MNAFIFVYIVFSALLNDKTLRKIAMQSDTKHTDLGYMLGLRSTDVEQIKYTYRTLTDQAFYILMVRQKCVPESSSFCLTKTHELC